MLVKRQLLSFCLNLAPHPDHAPQALPDTPESVLMLHNHTDTGTALEGLFLHVALSNGVLMRTGVDNNSGGLSDTRSRFLGTRPPKLFPCMIRGQRSMLALSSRPWLGYSDMGRFNISPLSYETLDYASSEWGGIVVGNGNYLQ